MVDRANRERAITWENPPIYPASPSREAQLREAPMGYGHELGNYGEVLYEAPPDEGYVGSYQSAYLKDRHQSDYDTKYKQRERHWDELPNRQIYTWEAPSNTSSILINDNKIKPEPGPWLIMADAPPYLNRVRGDYREDLLDREVNGDGNSVHYTHPTEGLFPAWDRPSHYSPTENYDDFMDPDINERIDKKAKKGEGTGRFGRARQGEFPYSWDDYYAQEFDLGEYVVPAYEPDLAESGVRYRPTERNQFDDYLQMPD